MRPSTPLLSSAAVAAVVSLFGLTYAERTGHLTTLESDTVQSQSQSREDAPTTTSDVSATNDGAAQSNAAPRRDGRG